MTNKKHPLYSVWSGMHTRCRNKNEPSYKYYGARGIKVCDRWAKFANFAKDMSDRPEGFSLGRIDGNGNYCPENCRWESAKQQARNKSNNRKISYLGETKTLAEWAEITKIYYATILYRLNNKWKIGQALGFEKRAKKPSPKRKMIDYNGKSLSADEWGKLIGLKRTTIIQRINAYGWPLDKALNYGVKK